jgi:hypothetical protein
MDAREGVAKYTLMPADAVPGAQWYSRLLAAWQRKRPSSWKSHPDVLVLNKVGGVGASTLLELTLIQTPCWIADCRSSVVPGPSPRNPLHHDMCIDVMWIVVDYVGGDDDQNCLVMTSDFVRLDNTPHSMQPSGIKNRGRRISCRACMVR